MKKNKFFALFLALMLTTVLFSCVKNNEPDNNGVIFHENIAIFPEPNSMVQVKIDTMGRSLPASKDNGELPVMLSLSAGGAVLNTYGGIKVQGSSTAKWPKKNWSLAFYSNENRTKKIKIKIGDSVASDMWIAKAEWVDPTILRNGVSYRLWESIVQSRKVFPQYEVDNARVDTEIMSDGLQTGAQGFPNSHPVQIKVNDKHYGISMLLLGHDPQNFNIDKNNPKHVYMEFDARGGYTDTKTWEKFLASGIGEWINGYHPRNEDFTDEQRESIDALGELINGTLANFRNNFDKHLDKTNMIDMLLFIEAVYDWDAIAQDIEMVTYDLKKWYMLPWDKDTTFGMYWDESGIVDGSEKTLLINYNKEIGGQKPWYKTYHAFTKDVEARYAELRDEGVFSIYNINKLVKDITDKIPNEIWDAEKDRWEKDNRPSLDETSPWQIVSWFGKRLEILDEHFNYNP